MKIERCNYCKFFKLRSGPKGELNRFRCYNPDTVRGNGSYRIINRDTAMKGSFPGWCKLEAYPV